MCGVGIRRGAPPRRARSAQSFGLLITFPLKFSFLLHIRHRRVLLAQKLFSFSSNTSYFSRTPAFRRSSSSVSCFSVFDIRFALKGRCLRETLPVLHFGILIGKPCPSLVHLLREYRQARLQSGCGSSLVHAPRGKIAPFLLCRQLLFLFVASVGVSVCPRHFFGQRLRRAVPALFLRLPCCC